MIKTREIAKEFRLAHWAGIMRERMESGLTVKMFCERIGIHPNSYHYWQRKLREAAIEGISAAMPDESGVSAQLPERGLAPLGWTEVTLAKTEAPRRVLAVEIGKGRILAEKGMDKSLFAEVCGILASLC